MYLLDTDVISQATKPRPIPKVLSWLRTIHRSNLHISVITVQEVRTGIEWLPDAARRRGLEEWLESDVLVKFAGRILPVDLATAQVCGRMVAEARRHKHTPELGDALIAATARVHGLTVATLNRDHFEKLDVEMVDW